MFVFCVLCEEDETRTHTGLAHYPLKVARLPFRHLSMKDFFFQDIGSSDCRAEDGAQTRDPQLGRLVLYQLSYFRDIILIHSFASRISYTFDVLWAGTDSNRRSRKATDLQSARFNHLPTYPVFS